MYYYWAGGGAANASDCKSDGLWPSGVQVPPCPHEPQRSVSEGCRCSSGSRAYSW